MKTLEQMEAEAEKSFELLEKTISNTQAMIECIERLSPEAYLDIVEGK